MQRLGLLGRLDPLDDHRQVERAGERDDRVQERRVGGLAAEVVDERLRDLEDVDREVAQVAERRVARPEVVEREPHAQVAQGVQLLDRAFGVAHRAALGDLERQRVRLDASSSASDSLDLVRDLRVL